MRELGAEPDLPQQGDTEEKIKYIFDVITPWKQRLNELYEVRFKTRIIEAKHSLAQKNLTDMELNEAISTEKKTTDILKKIDRGLRCLAAQLDE
jgi:hypothetical protein